MIKNSPFASLRHFAQILAKACVIVLIVNFGLLGLRVNPVRALVKLNTWSLMPVGRDRLAYPSDFQNGQLPLEALLLAHKISRPAAPNEFRVVLLGDSGIMGWGLNDAYTLSDQLTSRHMAVAGRQLIAYNLAYPQPSVVRDAVTLDAALAYHPDLVIWFVMPTSVDNAPDEAGSNRVFFSLNRDRLNALVERSRPLLDSWAARQSQADLTPDPAWKPYVAITDQELLPIWMNSLLYPFVPPDIGATDVHMGREDVPQTAKFADGDPGFVSLPNETWNFMLAGCREAQVSGALVLWVNRPILVGHGSYSAINYDALFERALYDRYRAALGKFAQAHNLWYLDLWDAIPAERYTDTPLHTDAEGYTILANAVQDALSHSLQDSPCRP